MDIYWFCFSNMGMYNIFGKVRCSATDKDLGMYRTSRIKVHIIFFTKKTSSKMKKVWDYQYKHCAKVSKIRKGHPKLFHLLLSHILSQKYFIIFFQFPRNPQIHKYSFLKNNELRPFKNLKSKTNVWKHQTKKFNCFKLQNVILANKLKYNYFYFPRWASCNCLHESCSTICSLQH
jgi:hypothetical protein